MNSRHFLLILLLTAVAFFAACNSDDDDKSITHGETPTRIMPLALNNQWDFTVVRVDSLGDTVQSLAQSMVITGDTTISGITWYRYQMGFGQTSDPLPMMANKTDGLWAFGPDSTDLPYMLAKYPASQGESWTNAAGIDTFFVKATDVNVTVSAGSYNCIEYAIHRQTDDSTHSYFSPGVGLVKQTFFANDGSQVRTELNEVTLH